MSRNSWLLRATRFPITLVVVSLFGSSGATASTTPLLTATQTHGSLLRADNSVCSFGRNENGELGDATVVDRYSPVAAASMLGSSISVASGWYHGLAVKADGTVWSWGYNGYNQLGDNTNVDKPTPNRIAGLSGFVAVAAGQNHSLALKNDGTVWSWGYNGYGQLGDGTNSNRAVPVQVINLPAVIAISAGANSSFALKSDGTILSWGYNDYGELGDGTTTRRLTPVPVISLGSVIKIASGADHTLALKSDGTVWAWGYNPQGELGDGSAVQRLTAVRASGLNSIASIAAGDNHSLALGSDGTVWAWGYNASGQLGDSTHVNRLTPVQISTFNSVAAVAAGSSHSIGLKTDGTLWAWGDNTYGELGNGSRVSSVLPVAAAACQANPAIPGPPRTSMSGRLAASQNFSLGITSADTTLGWGDNSNGQLGDGTIVARNTPVPAYGVSGAYFIAAGFYHSLVARNDGTVASWGYNNYGQLGDGSVTERTTPITVPNLKNFIAVAAGQLHSAALKSDGTVWTWGYNGYGQLGDGTTTSRTSPVQTINLTGVTAIAAGDYFTYALKNDGTVWAWGYNDYGALGDSTTTRRSTAVQVSNLTGVIAIAAGANHGLALKNDGTVWTWGYGPNGELGDGGTSERNNAVRASGLTNVVAIAGGDSHSLAVKSDGTVWAWGYNASGQLGIGSIAQSTVPLQVTGLSTALAVAAGSGHSLALLRDGSVWAWGTDAQGQFGIGSTVNSTIPVHGPAGFPFGPIYNLNLTASTAGAGTINTSYASPDGNFTAGRRVCLSGTPQVGWYLTGLSGATLDGSGCLTVVANNSVTANFTALAQLRFVPVTPCRVADTRGITGTFGGPIILGQTSRDFPIPQSTCGIPSNAAAYSLNVTVVPSGPLTYLTAWPTGTTQPNASVLNSYDGRVKANAAIVPAGTNGSVSIFMHDNSHVILDINGYFVPSSNTSALAFYPITPCRIADTRSTYGPLGGPSLVGGQARTFPILSSACGIPSGAQTYSLNLTAIPKTTLSYLTVWPASQGQPLVSTLNAGTGAVTANAAVVPAGSAGDISVFATDASDLIIDVNGYFAPAGNGGLSLYSLPPCRILDTRSPAGSVPFSGVLSTNAASASCSAPLGAQALVLNATVVPPASMPYLTLWPYGQNQPLVSTLNAYDATVTSNLAILPDVNGGISAYANAATHLLLDISGYFAP